MLSSSLCDYSDSYILVKGTIIAENIAAQAQPCHRQKGNI